MGSFDSEDGAVESRSWADHRTREAEKKAAAAQERDGHDRYLEYLMRKVKHLNFSLIKF